MAAVTGNLQLQTVIRTRVPAVTIAADSEIALGRIPVAQGVQTVTSVTYTPDLLITGTDTQSRTLTLFNRKGDNSGTVVVATLALTLTPPITAAKFVARTIPLSVVAGATDLAAGDVLSWQSLHIGTGLVDPGGLLEVTTTRA